MLTMTSLEAQNQFGYLIDTAQREPVTITRRGRPVAMVQAFQVAQTIPLHIASLIAETYPLRGQAAADALARASTKLGDAAQHDGLTEQGVAQIIRKARPDGLQRDKLTRRHLAARSAQFVLKSTRPTP